MGPEENMGTIGDVFLRLHGTKDLPEHMRSGPRNYNHNYNRVHNRVNEFRLLQNMQDVKEESDLWKALYEEYDDGDYFDLE